MAGHCATSSQARKTPIVGKKALRSYPVEETKGLVFVFLGDADYEPHPLSQDVPPTFLDEDMAVHGAAYMVQSNWRLGCENGIDDLHIYLHRQSPLITKHSAIFAAWPHGSSRRLLRPI